MKKRSALSRSLCGLFALSLLCLTPSMVAAQTPTESALANYELAKKAYKEGDFQRAADLLETAFAEDPDLIYQYNRVRAFQAMGKYDDALKVISLYKGPMQRDPNERFGDIEQLEAEIRRAKEEKEANTPKDPVGPTKNPDDPGQVTDPVKNDPVTPITEPPPKNGGKIAGLVLLCVGGATVLGTAPFWSGLLLRQDACYPDDSDPSGVSGSDCRDGVDDDREREAYGEKLDSHRLIGGVGAIGGGVIAATGLVIFLVTRDKGEASAPPSDTTLFLPEVGADRVGANILIRF